MDSHYPCKNLFWKSYNLLEGGYDVEIIKTPFQFFQIGAFWWRKQHSYFKSVDNHSFRMFLSLGILECHFGIGREVSRVFAQSNYFWSTVPFNSTILYSNGNYN